MLSRKGKRNKAAPVSIYNPGEHDILPGLRIPITTEEEDSHIYEYIVETQVYSDLPNFKKQCTESGMVENCDPPQNGSPLPESAMVENPTTKYHNMIDNELYG